MKTRPCREKEAEHRPGSTSDHARRFHCQDNLEKKACGQLLPLPQEGLTSDGLSHRPASNTALYVTASLGGGGGSGDDGDCWKRVKLHVPLFLLFPLYAQFALSVSLSPLYPSEGKEDEGRAGKAHMEVQVKITTPDLS